MIGKATLKDLLEKAKAPTPLYQINMDSFLSSFTSIKGYVHAVVIVYGNSRNKWLSGMKTKDEMIYKVKGGTAILQIFTRNIISSWS
jgi:hypothetical protein